MTAVEATRDQFDEVYDSIVNGQMTQAVRQCERLCRYDRAELTEYIADELNQPEIAVNLMKAYFILELNQ